MKLGRIKIISCGVPGQEQTHLDDGLRHSLDHGLQNLDAGVDFQHPLLPRVERHRRSADVGVLGRHGLRSRQVDLEPVGAVLLDVGLRLHAGIKLLEFLAVLINLVTDQEVFKDHEVNRKNDGQGLDEALVVPVLAVDVQLGSVSDVEQHNGYLQKQISRVN